MSKTGHCSMFELMSRAGQRILENVGVCITIIICLHLAAPPGRSRGSEMYGRLHGCVPHITDGNPAKSFLGNRIARDAGPNLLSPSAIPVDLKSKFLVEWIGFVVNKQSLRVAQPWIFASANQGISCPGIGNDPKKELLKYGQAILEYRGIEFVYHDLANVFPITDRPPCVISNGFDIGEVETMTSPHPPVGLDRIRMYRRARVRGADNPEDQESRKAEAAEIGRILRFIDGVDEP
ncbi:hypothetical protein FPV67DRAFT_1455199 [Lyophyllum atratum]|nr:hypothetical protein FPV67DRAFT_1455199 [Lyophyllum atratum]